MSTKSIGQYYRKAFQDWSGGLNTQSNALKVRPNQFVQLDDCLVNDSTLLEKAPGYLKDAAAFPDVSTNFLRMLVNYRRGSSVDKLVVAASDSANSNATYKVDLKETIGDSGYAYIAHTAGTDASFTNGNTAVTGVGTSWLSHLKAGDKIKASSHSDTVYGEIQSVNTDTSITLTAGYGGATAANVAYKARIILHKDFIPQAITFNNNLVITNGSETPMSYNNTTLNLITDAQAPKGKFIEAHKNRVFIAATSGNPSRIFWSATNDETSWDGAALEDVFPQDNGTIVAIKSFADSLIVLKDNGRIYQVLGQFDQTSVGEVDFIRRIDAPENMGQIASYSPVVADNKLFFLAQTGIYALDSKMYVQKISWDIDPTTDAITLRGSSAAAKSYTFDTKTQWDLGTHSGTRADTGGTLRQYCDQYVISGVRQEHNLASGCIGADNKLHAAYAPNTSSSTTESVAYTTIDVDGTVITETGLGLSVGATGATTIGATSGGSLAVGVSSGGIVGIAASYNTTGSSPTHKFIERHTGTAAFTNGSTTITGSGTSWSTQLNNGSLIKSSTDSTWYTVASVDGNTQVTLTTAYAGTTAASATFIAWTAPVTIQSNMDSSAERVVALAIKYSSSNPTLAAVTDNGTLHFVSRAAGVAGSWTKTNVASGFTSETQVPRVSLAINSTDVYISWTPYNSRIQAYKSTDSGSSFSTVEALTGKGLANYDGVQVSYDGSGNTLSGYSESGSVKKRNHTGASNSTLDSTANGQCLGYIYYSSNDYAANNVGASGSQTEKYVFETSSTVTTTDTNVLSKTHRLCQALDNNAATFCSVAFGASAETLYLRRVAFRGIWTSDERSDSTLTAWGTYDVGGQTAAGATITHEVALNTTSPVSSYTAIVPGAVISSDAASIYIKARITGVLGTLSSPSWESLVLNYTGSGIDARFPCGCVFDNEYYLSYTESGQANNNKMLLTDKELAFTTLTPDVTFMTRFRNKLYAGSATNGDVYILNQTYTHNGTNYTSTAITKEDLLGSIELEKDVYKVYVLYDVQASGTFNFSYRTDSFTTATGSAWSTATTIDQTEKGIAEVPIKKKCRSLQFKVESTSYFAIVGFVVLYDYLGLR